MPPDAVHRLPPTARAPSAPGRRHRHGARTEPRHPARRPGRGEIRRHGRKVALLAFGSLVPAALTAGDALDATVVNMRFVKPSTPTWIAELAGNHSLLVSIEENAVIGGAGSEIARVLSERGISTPLLRLGLPDRFIDHGEQGQLLAELGLDRKASSAQWARLTKEQ